MRAIRTSLLLVMSLATHRKITYGLGSALLLLLVVAGIALVSTHRLVEDAAWVAHTYEVRHELRVIDDQLDDGMSEVRGYMLSGQPEFIAHARIAVDSARTAYDRLLRTTADDPVQHHAVTDLGVAFRARIAQFESALARGRLLGASDAEITRQLAADETLFLRMDAMIGAADRREQELLEMRAADEATSALVIWLVVGALAAIATAIVITVSRSVRRDLLGRARAEEALRASEAKFAGILELCADGIITVAQDQRIVQFNRGAEQIFGYTAAEVIGRPLDVLLPERYAGVHDEAMRRFAAAPEAAHRVGDRPLIIGRRRDGEEFTAEASISKLPTPDGMLFTVVLRDVTDRNRRERLDHTLAAVGARMATSLDFDERLAVVTQLPVPVVGSWCVLDLVEEEEGGSSRMCRVVSTHDEPALNVCLRAYASREGAIASHVHTVLETGDSLLFVDAAAMSGDQGADGELRALAASMGSTSLLIVPLLRGGVIMATMTIGSAPGARFTDVDVNSAEILARRAALAIENGRLFRAAQRATAARDQVLGAVSHDLRNPLSAIAMCARALLEAPATDDAKRREQSQTILDATDFMQRLLQDLLDVVTLQAGRLSVDADVEAVAPIVEAARELFAARAVAQGIALRTAVPDALPLVRADGSRVLQVLANLVGNALKFTPPGGSITVAAEAADGEVVLSVQDTGCGIPADALPHLFERFWKTQRRGGPRGFGLGLTIAQGIVAAHGGRLWAESQPGQGSTFRFTLPLAGSLGSGAPELTPGASRTSVLVS